MRAFLEDLLALDAESIAGEAGRDFDRITEDGRRPLVLLGAGQMGRALAASLRGGPQTVLGFADNGPARWGSTLDGLPVLAPAEAVRAHGAEAVFVLAFQADEARLELEEARLRALGAERVARFPALLRRWPQANGWPAAPPSYYRERAEDLEALFGMLADGTSRGLLEGLLRWRLLRDYEALPQGSPADQYFNPGCLRLREDERLLDGGAFDGDTLSAFLKASSGRFERIHAVEPDPASCAALRGLVASLPEAQRTRIQVHEAALGAAEGRGHLQNQGDHLSSLGDQGLQVRTLSLDHLAADEPLTFLKLDLEGSEAEALAGAGARLRRDRPLVALAVYHRPGDLLDLPLRLRDALPGHRFHLRVHNRFGLDTVLYAVPPDRSA